MAEQPSQGICTVYSHHTNVGCEDQRIHLINLLIQALGLHKLLL